MRNRAVDGGAPGKRTLTEQVSAHSGPEALGAYPHASTISSLTGVSVPGRAVIDPEDCRSAGVEAFTVGDTTRFSSMEPSLRVAAHEAAHQAQHAGLTNDGGMGAERHADAVATAVHGGRSAAELFGRHGARVDAGFHAYTVFSAADQTGGKSAGWKDPAGNPLKISDDGKMALSDSGYGSAKVAWGVSSEIAKSADLLKKQGSRIALSAGATDISGKNPASGSGATHTLARIEVKDAVGAASTELTDDCGTAMHEATGGYTHGNKGSAAIKNAAGNEEYTSPIAYHGGYGGSPDTTTPEEWFEEILKKEFGAKSRADLYKDYDKLSASDKAKFAKKYGIDEKAVPKVGQGITTFSQFDMPGWSAKPGHASDTWNFHYATNILASEKDYITLENYAGHGKTNWFFDMIGPTSKGQSFHEMHGGSDQFGTSYSTLVVEPGHALDGQVNAASVHFVKKPELWSIDDKAHPGNEIARLDKGTKITVVEKASTWWRVEVKSGPHTGKIGWIMSNYFEIA
jgi:hypothetical protein